MPSRRSRVSVRTTSSPSDSSSSRKITESSVRTEYTSQRGDFAGPGAQHRAERHHARAAADEQQRPAVGRLPREVAADRPAELECVAGAYLVDEVRRDLTVVDSLDRQRELRVVRPRRDRVRALGLVAVLRSQADVDVLPGPMPFPAVDVEDERPRPVAVSSTTAATCATRHVSRPSTAVPAMDRRSCGSRSAPRSRARRRRAT